MTRIWTDCTRKDLHTNSKFNIRTLIEIAIISFYSSLISNTQKNQKPKQKTITTTMKHNAPQTTVQHQSNCPTKTDTNTQYQNLEKHPTQMDTGWVREQSGSKFRPLQDGAWGSWINFLKRPTKSLFHIKSSEAKGSSSSPPWWWWKDHRTPQEPSRWTISWASSWEG